MNLIGARLLGLERGRLLHQHLVPLVAKADRLAFSAFLESVFEGQTKKSCEVTVPREGSPPLVVQIECMRSAEGQECRAVLFDITEGKQAEGSLRLFRTLVDRSSDAIEVLDPETGRFLDVNERGCRDLGYSREELLALSVFDVDPKVQQSAFTKIMQELRKSSVLMWQSIHRRKDGSTFPVEVNLKYIQLDRAYVVTVVRDVTERKQAEAALLLARTRQTLLGDILRVSLEHTPLELKLAKVLDLLLAVPELSLQRKGAIFLMEAGTLVMKAHRNLSEAVLTACARVPLRKCLCGRAAASGQIEFCGDLDERHEIRYDGIEPHGHYCVPIGSGDQVSGVIALYLASGHKREERAEQFLMAAADALSGMIEHQRAEEAVRQSEEHFRAMFEVACIGMASADPQTGRFVRVNQKMCAITGYSAAELLHLRVSEITHPNDRQKDWEVFQRVVRGEIPDYHLEKRYVRKDGAVAWVNVNMTVIRDAAGQPERTMATIEDITERRRAEESHTRLTTAIEQSAETTMITDPNSTILYVNPAFEKTSGYTREEAIGHNPRFLKSGKHDAEFYRQIWAILGRGDVWSGRLINKKKDGTLYEEDASISPVRDAAGNVVNYVAVKRDVTHEAQLEAQLRQAQKMEAVGQLTGGVAHDFNNMLAVIRGNAELLLVNEAQHTPQTREGLKHVVAASERAANLTRQLLAFSRKQVLQLQPVLLNTIIANLTKMLHRVLRENIDLQCHYAAPLSCVQADPGMIEQVILNLVVNARDAMPEGGQLRVATEQLTLDEAHARVNPEACAGEFVCLSVSDTGTGIAPEVLPRIFEPFFTTKEAGKGTGLGLATVYGIVKQHQGWIEVSSRVGEGSTFKVFLPAIATPDRLPAAAEAGADILGGKETILLVEDEHTVRLTTRRVLESKGYTVREAASAQEALELWQSHAGEIALLLTDMVMPGELTGRDLAERLWGQRPGLKVIFMSGYGTEVLGQNPDFIRRTRGRFLQKPFPSRTILETVRQCLDQQESEAAPGKKGQATDLPQGGSLLSAAPAPAPPGGGGA